MHFLRIRDFLARSCVNGPLEELTLNRQDFKAIYYPDVEALREVPKDALPTVKLVEVQERNCEGT